MMNSSTQSLLPGGIQAPRESEPEDCCLYSPPDSSEYLVVKCAPPHKPKRFDEAEKALEYAKVQARLKVTLVWISSDQGNSWKGYSVDAIDIGSLLRNF